MTLSFEQNERKAIQIYTNELINQVLSPFIKSNEKNRIKITIITCDVQHRCVRKRQKNNREKSSLSSAHPFSSFLFNIKYKHYYNSSRFFLSDHLIKLLYIEFII